MIEIHPFEKAQHFIELFVTKILKTFSNITNKLNTLYIPILAKAILQTSLSLIQSNSKVLKQLFGITIFEICGEKSKSFRAILTKYWVN